MKEMVLDKDELAVLSGEDIPAGPNMIEQLLILASQDMSDLQPSVAEKVAELNSEGMTQSESSWESWYSSHVHESKKDAIARLSKTLEALQENLAVIDDAILEQYVEDELVTDTYLGSRVRHAVLRKIAEELHTSYDFEEGDDHVDGYLAEQPVVIHPYVDHDRLTFDEENKTKVILFKRDHDELRLFLDF